MEAMSKHKILVVEDEVVLNDAYKTILESAGYEVCVAFDGEEGMKCLEDFKADVILLDLKMPRVDGIGFLKKFAELEKKPKLKIILFSNYDLQEEIDEAYSLGVERYVLKSWASPKDLLKIVGDTLKS